MLRKTVAILMAAAVFMVALSYMAYGETIKAKHSVELKDPAGDVSEGDDPGKDVVKLSIKSDGKNLTFSVQLKDDIEHYLKGHMAGDVVQINIDTDNKESTGGSTFWGKKKGFEYAVKINTCIEYESGSACAGGLGGSPEKAYYSAYKVEKFLGDDSQTDRILDTFFDSKDRTYINGKTVNATVAYSLMGLSSGKAVRIAVRESDSSYDEKSFFPDVLLTLK